jgi:hypothetical protein
MQQLLFQTWDVIESPMFSSVFKDATNICLNSIFSSLKYNVFCDEDNNPRSPPLARLLPQLKVCINVYEYIYSHICIYRYMN